MYLKHSFVTLIVIFFLSANIFSQDSIGVNEKGSNDFFLKKLTNSKDNLYQTILDKYVFYIKSHPDDVQVRIERCKFIGNAYYDEYDDYNYKYDETEECISSLYRSYPENSGVLVYKAQNTYGDSLKVILNDAESKIVNSVEYWDPDDIAEIYRMQAYQYDDENPMKAIDYAKKAQRNNDSLDLTLVLAKAYKKIGNKKFAITALNSKISNDEDPWILRQKADLFLEMGESQEALILYNKLTEKDSTYIVNSDLSKVFYNIGDFEAARVYLLKDTINEWGKNKSIQDLLSFDIKHSSGLGALLTYNRMQELSYYDDLLGFKRLKIFIKDPTLKISLNDLSHILVLLLVLIVLFLIPYLWILPIFGVGSFLKNKGKIFNRELPYEWSLKHFWIYSFLYLLVSFIVIIVFEYQTTVNYYFDIVTSYETAEEGESVYSANSTILYMLLMAVSTFLVIRKQNIKYLYTSRFKLKKLLVFGVVFVFLNITVIYVYKSIFGGIEETNTFLVLNIREAIISVINKYGILSTLFLVGFLVPVYEEVIFRGIVLSSTEKYIGFNAANVIQATFFALVHDSLFLFPFYLLFGVFCGLMAKKSGGLMGSIVLHSINNIFAVLSIYLLFNASN